MLFTDASKYGWAGVLTQPYEEIDKLTQLTANVGYITEEDSDSSPCLIHQWTFQRKPAELGCPYEGSLCYLHVHQKAQLLPHQC